jgi:phage-related protein
MHCKLLQSARWSISALCRDENTVPPAWEFIVGLDEADQIKFLNLFQFTIDNGPPHNPKKFKFVEQDLYEFKAKPHRILCFFAPGQHIILTHGFKKQKQRLERREIDKALRMKSEYEAAKEENHAGQ